MPEILPVMIVVFAAVFTQTVAGFAIALVSMPLLTALVGLKIAAPLVAIIGLTARAVMLTRYRSHFSLSDVWRLMLAATIGIPCGTLVFHTLDSHLVEMLLGVVVLLYALSALLLRRLPALKSDAWAYGLGFVSGILTGAYNVGGPPAVIYASGRRWPPETFKGNFQAFTMMSGILVTLVRASNGEFTVAVMRNYLFVLPAIALGLIAGFWLDQFINPTNFRKLVLALLVVIGVQLIF